MVCLRAAAGSGLAADLDLAGATLGLPVVGCVLSLLEAVDPPEAELEDKKRREALLIMRSNEYDQVLSRIKVSVLNI